MTGIKKNKRKKELKQKQPLTLEPSLAEDLKCTGLGNVSIPFTEIAGVSPQLEGQLKSLH